MINDTTHDKPKNTTNNILKHRQGTRLGSTRAMADYGETMAKGDFKHT